MAAGSNFPPFFIPTSVIPACFKRWFDMAHHRRVLNWTPDKNIRG